MKILLADPHPEVQSALRLMIDRLPQPVVVSEASSLVQFLAECSQACPDLILVDPGLVPPSRSHTQKDVASMIRVLRRLCPDARVVIMSSRFEAEQEALAAGASGFISKTDAPDVVLSAIVRFLENC